MIVIDDEAVPPVIVFDSAEKLFNCTNLVSDSVSLPQRRIGAPNGAPEVDSYWNVNYELKNVHVSATHVLGSFSVTSGSPHGLPGVGVFAAGGTYVHLQKSKTTHNNSVFFHPDLYAGYTFFASGGKLYLNEEVYLNTGTANTGNETLYITLLAFTLNYKLFVGTLT